MEVCNGTNQIKSSGKSDTKVKVHVEIAQLNSSSLKNVDLVSQVGNFLSKKSNFIGSDYTLYSKDLPPHLQSHVLQIHISDIDSLFDELADVEVVHHVYKLDDEGPAVEELGESEEDVPAATHWLLPSADFKNLWETLIYDSNIKDQLLQFVSTTLLFSDKGVDSSIIAWNRVLLLHGPPGTGKTSLCKALAQKLSIRLGHRYKYGQLIEVNSHSLFSKWFSESGKLVQKMFSKIMEMVEDTESLVCVLIDEVESLTRARCATASGADPSDALRVVNALLTQLDHIKRYPNVLILTTSNISDSIDLAFVDRADIKQYIGLPSKDAIYQIYHSCLTELMAKGIISPTEQLLTLRQIRIIEGLCNNMTRNSMYLYDISQKSVGLSGRSIRKLPFLAHALHTSSPINCLNDFLKALEDALQKFKEDSEHMKNGDFSSNGDGKS